MEGKDQGTARESKPVLPMPRQLMEDDEEGVTGVVHVAHKNAVALAKDVDVERARIAARMEALRDKLSNSGPIALRPKKR